MAFNVLRKVIMDRYLLELSLIGMGTGNPEHLTLQAIRVLRAADLVLIPSKGSGKEQLRAIRELICTDVLGSVEKLHEFSMPIRDISIEPYTTAVAAWHDAVAEQWRQAIDHRLPKGGHVALLIWGDPGLYDSSLRIADRLLQPIIIHVIPGITSIQALTAAHAIPLNDVAEPFLVTTGRHLRTVGWPSGVGRIVVMLDGACSFQNIDPSGVTIYWAAYAGMPQELRISGSLSEVGAEIIQARQDARARHGWVMDIYLLERQIGGPNANDLPAAPPEG